MIASVKKLFKDYFLTGILFLGPLAIVLFVVKTVIEGADNILQTSRWLPVHVPGLGVLLSLAIILVAGFLGRNLLGRYVFSTASGMITHLPFLGGVYKSVKQVFETLFVNHEKHFSRVVLIPFPGPGGWTLAFVTSENAQPEIQKLYSEPMICLFLPTSPIPTNGYYVYFAKKDVKATSLKVDEAFKIIISLGLVTPDEVKTPELPHGH
jgi:uncharacterized membrane protein